MKKFAAFCITCLVITGCVIQEEYRFNEDASGEYSMAFNMDALMGMGMGDDEKKEKEVIDTVITFDSFLEEKKDSISQLPLEEQEKLELLRPLTFEMNVNDSLQTMDMRMSYAFKTLEDIQNFSEAVDMANIKELDDMGFGSSDSTETDDTGIQKTSEDLFGSANAYTTKFNKRGFSRIIKPESREELIAQRDTSESSFGDAIILRQVYKFPYKIKSVDNPLAKIHADFKGVEVEANMMQLNNNPDVFNIVVQFER